MIVNNEYLENDKDTFRQIKKVSDKMNKRDKTISLSTNITVEKNKIVIGRIIFLLILFFKNKVLKKKNTKNKIFEILKWSPMINKDNNKIDMFIIIN